MHCSAFTEREMAALLTVCRELHVEASLAFLLYQQSGQAQYKPAQDSHKSASTSTRVNYSKSDAIAPLQFISSKIRTDALSFTDVVVTVDGGAKFECHACVLSARSLYFACRLANEWLAAANEYVPTHENEAKKLPLLLLTLPCASNAAAFEIVLNFMYTDKLGTAGVGGDKKFSMELLVDVLGERL